MARKLLYGPRDIPQGSLRVKCYYTYHMKSYMCLVKVSAGGFSTVIGYLKFVQRGYDLMATLALLPIICIVSACLLTIMLICMRKQQSCGVKQKRKTPVDISYVQVAPGNDVVSSLTHWPLRRQPSPLLSRQ